MPDPRRAGAGPRGASRSPVRFVAAGLVLGVVVSGCVSGRVLSGYPGRPFLRFDVPAPADSVFFAAGAALEDEGFALDYTLRQEGLLNTRPAQVAGRPVLLNVVVEPANPGNAGSSRVWVAAYEETFAGAERVDPLREEIWSAVVATVQRLSERLGGGEVSGPDERAPRPPAGA